MASTDLSDAIQDYLKEIYKLGAQTERVSTSALARRQHVSAASASAMVKKLAALHLVEHAPYRGVSLTPEGERVAIEVLGISCITHAAAGVFPEPLHHSEVMETTQQVKGEFISLLEGIIGRL